MYTSCVLRGALRFFFSIKLNYLLKKKRISDPRIGPT
jgi:hypothetical protein